MGGTQVPPTISNVRRDLIRASAARIGAASRSTIMTLPADRKALLGFAQPSRIG